MKTIIVTAGKLAPVAALVDDQDYDALSLYKWYVDRDGYIARNASRAEMAAGSSKGIAMHRQVIGACRGGQFVDHINRCRNDNRRKNLRFVTNQENMRNADERSDNKTGHKGVTWDSSRGMYYASLAVNHKTIGLGRWETIELAKLSRELGERAYFGHVRRQITV